MKPEDKFTGDMLQDRCRSEVQRYEKRIYKRRNAYIGRKDL